LRLKARTIRAETLGRRGAMVRCMLLTGCKRSEAASMEWAHLRLHDAVLGPHWEQPGRLTKSKEPHRVPLSAPGLAMLRWLPLRVTERAGHAALVFAGRGNKTAGGWTLIRRALLTSAGVDTGTMHHFRRTIVSALGPGLRPGGGR
jgi:integrase